MSNFNILFNTGNVRIKLFYMLTDPFHQDLYNKGCNFLPVINNGTSKGELIKFHLKNVYLGLDEGWKTILI